jgi:hypothetical protein
MTARTAAAVLALTRAWLRVYTCGAQPRLARARRTEIESDLWEMQHDADLGPPLRYACIALTRLITGIPDDIAWRFDCAAEDEQMIVRRVFAFTAATLLVVSLWMVPSLFLNGQKEIAACAAAAPQPQTNADLRLQVMRCAGAFFSPAR